MNHLAFAARRLFFIEFILLVFFSIKVMGADDTSPPSPSNIQKPTYDQLGLPIGLQDVAYFYESHWQPDHVAFPKTFGEFFNSITGHTHFTIPNIIEDLPKNSDPKVHEFLFDYFYYKFEGPGGGLTYRDQLGLFANFIRTADQPMRKRIARNIFRMSPYKPINDIYKAAIVIGVGSMALEYPDGWFFQHHISEALRGTIIGKVQEISMLVTSLTILARITQGIFGNGFVRVRFRGDQDLSSLDEVILVSRLRRAVTISDIQARADYLDNEILPPSPIRAFFTACVAAVRGRR